MTMKSEPVSYTNLQRFMHEALRAQHPEWIQPNGESPACDDYESRFAELLNLFSENSDRRSSQLTGKGAGRHDFTARLASAILALALAVIPGATAETAGVATA